MQYGGMPVDYRPIYDLLKKAEVDDGNLKYFAEKARKIAAKLPEVSSGFSNNANRKKVFIIHGHDRVAVLELEKMLKEEFNLSPIVSQHNPNDGMDTIISKFERLSADCVGAIALFTPDDQTISNAFRARQNVILELGYFMGRDRGSHRKIIVLKKGNIEIPSDIDGVIYVAFNNSVNEVHSKIKMQLAHWRLI